MVLLRIPVHQYTNTPHDASIYRQVGMGSEEDQDIISIIVTSASVCNALNSVDIRSG